VRGTGLLLARSIGQAFAAVGAQEEKREEHAAEAEHREHDLAGGRAVRGVEVRRYALRVVV